MAERHRTARFAAVLMLFLVVTSVVVGTVAAQPDCSTVSYDEDVEGNQLVENVDQLQCIAADPVGSYELGNDIDADETFDWNNGTGFEPIGVTFRGTFDGDGYTIMGLYINRTETDVGLFASTSGDAVVKNVALEEVRITGEDNVGGLVGRNEGEVRNSHVTGIVTGVDEVSTGGLVGRNVGGVVTRSSSSADVIGHRYVGGLVGRNTGEVSLSYSDGTVEGDDTMGGLVGYNLGTVHDTYSTADAEGRVTVAGLVGRNRGTAVIRNSYAAGKLSGTTEVRGLVAGNSATVEGSYFDESSVTGMGNPLVDPGGFGLTTEEMTGERARNTMSALDFEETWVTTDDYPVLAWQMEDRPVLNGDDGEDDDGDSEDGDGEDGTDDGDDGVGDGMDGEDDGTGDGTDDGADNETDDGTDADAEDGTDTDDNATGDDGGEDGTDDTGDDGGEGMPGFGIFVAVVAVVAVGISRRFNGIA